ncbi:probable tubulin polyglutamylase TTLL2 isoform X2 [Bolinopsis microptera]|uniref:probable tubulin polyglutamylase TTLL2 isoform X2 n=1 Tax=Bolinopsis microptera TaxID=2820187 RepID=UPI00307AD126
MNQRPSWLFYKTDNGIPQLLSKALNQEQFKEVPETHRNDQWNLYWRGSGFTLSDYKNVKTWQILNHFPKGNTITRKDSLARCLKRMRMVHGTIFNFFPVSFNLPNDYTKFLSYFSKIQSKKGKQVWICKPSDLSRGRGIFLFDNISDLLYDGSTVVQRYIEDPYLIGGYKFDLRLYAVVTSYHPLRIYLHQDGLVRFSTEKYAGSVIHNKFAHLTNTSINRNGPNYNVEKERVGAGCKWSISQLRAYFQQCSVDDRLAWERIKHMISLTILMQANSIPESAKQCIELYGFDIILDKKLKPWLLEVNFTPALGNDCSADVAVKLPMLVDLLTLAKQKITLPRPVTDHRRKNNNLSRQAVILKEEQNLLELLIRQTKELSVLRRDKADQSKMMKSIARHEKLRKKCRMLFEKKSQDQEQDPEERQEDLNHFDDVFRNRFIMDPAETERMKAIERRVTKIPDIKKTGSIIDQNSKSHTETDSVISNRCSTVSSIRSQRAQIRSHSSSSFRNNIASYPQVANSEYKVGGFFLTFPISNNTQTYSKGATDIAKSVTEIRNSLRISETNFKFMPAENRQLHERTTVNWNVMSGFKQT